MKLFPPRGAPASQIVHPLDPMAETQLRLKKALLSLSAMISENFNQEKIPGLIYLLCHIMLRRCRMRQRIALRLAAHTSSVQKLNIDQSRVVTGARTSRDLGVGARVTKGHLTNPLGS